MEKNEELSDKIADLIYQHPKYESGGVSMYTMGVEEEDEPLVWSCSDIKVRVSIVRRYWVYLSVYRKGCNECGCWAKCSEVPSKTLREVYKIVKKYFK